MMQIKKIQETLELVRNQDLTISFMIIKGISDNIVNVPGEMHYREITIEETVDRRNYREADNIDYRDGDLASSIYYLDPSMEDKPNRMYEWGVTTLISNRSRVYKGGSWSDRAYYIQPAVRRYLDERRATADIGFRCAMSRVGSPGGLGNNKR